MTQQYKDEKTRADTLHNQKTQLSSRIEERNDEMDRKVVGYEELLRKKNDSYEI
jgi:hypothetical protein